MHKSRKATRHQSRHAVPASRRQVASASAWEIYGVPEEIEAPASTPLRAQQAPQIRPVVAVHQTKEQIELVFFPE